MIIEQHLGLLVNDVKPDEIKAVLNSYSAGKTLLLIDGYDQYEHGSNASIDDVLEKRNLWKCLVLLSSRETQQVKVLRRYLDDEIKLQGIDKAKVYEYIDGPLGDKNKGGKLWRRVEEILNLTEDEEWVVNPTPLVINMICVSDMSEDGKRKSKTEAVRDLGDKYLDRESIRSTGRKSSTRLNKQTVNELAKLSWEGLNGLAGENNSFTLVISALNLLIKYPFAVTLSSNKNQCYLFGWLKRSLSQSIGSFSCNPHFALFLPGQRLDIFGNVSDHWGMVTYNFFQNSFLGH